MSEQDALKALLNAITYLMYGGAVWIAGKMYSQFLETIPGWHDKVPSWVKPYLVLAIALFIAMLATVLVILPPDTFDKLKPFLIAIGATLVTWYSSQKEYERIKASEEK